MVSSWAQSNINSGDVVAFWQGFLASYGAVPCPSGIDGHFTATTTAGTKAIQGFFGLTKDGVVGPNTWGAAGAWLVWSPGTAIYDLWQPLTPSRTPTSPTPQPEPNGSLEVAEPVTTDYPTWHALGLPGHQLQPTSGTCG